MIHKILDFVLLVAIAIGGVLAWRTDGERHRLTATYRRLAQLTGDLVIDDPSKVHLLALDTGEQRHFAWRVYLPPNYTQIIKHNGGHRHSSWSRNAIHSIARVRIQENDQGQLMLFTQTPGGSSLMGLGAKSTADLLRDRWDEVRIEQLGTGGVAVVEPDRPAALLRLTLSDSIADEARTKLDQYTIERHVPILLNLELDPNAPSP